MNKHDFVVRLYAALKIAKQKGAILNAQAAAAQAALESGWGNSGLAEDGNNLFGMKIDMRWLGPVYFGTTYEYQGGKYVKYKGTGKVYPFVGEAIEAAVAAGIDRKKARVAMFRAYPSWNECLVDYAKFISERRWFADALKHADPPAGDGDAEQWIYRLVDRDYSGEMAWATSPYYASKVMALVDDIEALA